MNDPIDRQAAIEAVKNAIVTVLYHDAEPVDEAMEEAIEATKRSAEASIEALPSAQPDLSGYSDRLWKAAYERGKAEAQRTGKWMRNPDDTAGSGYFICSECRTDFYDVWKYCPNCGAKMEGTP